MKRFSLAVDVLISVAVFPLVVFIYMYAGHTTHEKPAKTDTHRKTEVKTEPARIVENISSQPSGKTLFIKKISATEVFNEEDRLTEDTIRRLFNTMIHDHDSNIYLIVPPAHQIDSVHPF